MTTTEQRAREVLAAKVGRLKALSSKATDGAWLHYDKIFRKKFGNGRVTEIQRYGDGKAIVNWGGFDGLPDVTARKKNHNARFIVELVNFFRKHADELSLAFASPPTTGGDVTQGEEADRIAAAEYVSKAFGEQYRHSVLNEGRWPDLVQAFRRHRLAALPTAQAAEGPTTDPVSREAAAIETAAIQLWHRFGSPDQLEWEDEPHKAEYRLAAEDILRALPTAQAVEGSFQDRVQPWPMACLGEMIAGDREERNHRFLEEGLELVQSCGCTASEAHQLVDYVFGREVGEPAQEVGGVMVTLAALCLANGLDMHANGETELARIWTKVETIRAKQAAKPKHSPLPAHPTTDPVSREAANPPLLGEQDIAEIVANYQIGVGLDFEAAWEDAYGIAQAILRALGNSA